MTHPKLLNILTLTVVCFFLLTACNTKQDIAFLDLKLGKKLDWTGLEKNTDLKKVSRGETDPYTADYYYKFANDCDGRLSFYEDKDGNLDAVVLNIGVICDQKVISKKEDFSDLNNLKYDTYKGVCDVDTTKMSYIKDLYFKKYGKPDFSFVNYQPDISSVTPKFQCENYYWKGADKILFLEVWRANLVLYPEISKKNGNAIFSVVVKYMQDKEQKSDKEKSFDKKSNDKQNI